MITSGLCLITQEVNGILVQCGGEIKEIISEENGRKLLYEVCSKCGENQSLAPISLAENTVIYALTPPRSYVRSVSKKS